jgi:hypothetical protein
MATHAIPIIAATKKPEGLISGSRPMATNAGTAQIGFDFIAAKSRQAMASAAMLAKKLSTNPHV